MKKRTIRKIQDAMEPIFIGALGIICIMLIGAAGYGLHKLILVEKNPYWIGTALTIAIVITLITMIARTFRK